MTALIDALRRKYRTPHEAMTALGLDADLLGPRLGLDAAPGGDEEEAMAIQMTPKASVAAGMFLGRFGQRLKSGAMAMDAASAASLFGPIFAGITSKNFAAQMPALDAALRATLKGRLANDADLAEVSDLLKEIEGIQAGEDTATEANAGMPAYMREEPEDADDETPEEREEDEGCDARAADAKKRLGRDEADDEAENREEENEFKPDTSKTGASDARLRARDALKMRRAADAKKRLGRDEEPKEKEDREKREEAEDRRHARARHRMGRDYRRARDAHRAARDAHRKHANDWRKASDAHKSAMDARKADDAAKAAMDMKRADDAAREAHDAMVRARDARHRARDARRAHDAAMRRARDEENMEPRGEMITKAAMDQAIDTRVADAVAANDRRHREIAEARAVVRPKAGDIAMDSAINTASDVYAKALDVLGVNYSGITDQVALRRLFEVAPRPGAGNPGSGSGGFANDAAPATGAALFKKLLPNAARVERV
jgi:hypothetical protein